MGGEPQRGMAEGSDQNTSYKHVQNRQKINMKLPLKRKLPFTLLFSQKVSNLKWEIEWSDSERIDRKAVSSWSTQIYRKEHSAETLQP